MTVSRRAISICGNPFPNKVALVGNSWIIVRIYLCVDLAGSCENLGSRTHKLSRVAGGEDRNERTVGGQEREGAQKAQESPSLRAWRGGGQSQARQPGASLGQGGRPVAVKRSAQTAAWRNKQINVATGWSGVRWVDNGAGGCPRYMEALSSAPPQFSGQHRKHQPGPVRTAESGAPPSSTKVRICINKTPQLT